jgi:hypothetical protein
MSKIPLIFIVMILWFGPAAFASEPSAFSQYLNGDGSSIDEAVIIDKPVDLKPCNFGTCYNAEFPKIVRQEHDYLVRTYGKEGVDWEIVGETAMEVDIDLNDKFYDKIAIKLISTQEKKIIYFDITVPYKLIS